MITCAAKSIPHWRTTRLIDWGRTGTIRFRKMIYRQLMTNLGNYPSSSLPMIKDEDHSHLESEKETVEHIIKQEKSAAGILCVLKTSHGSQTSHLPLTKDVLGIVATLVKVDDDNLSRLLSEYLGIETMLAIVCKTYHGVKALETYEKDGSINKSSCLHGLGTSIGRHLDGRFLVVCLENLRGDIDVKFPKSRVRSNLPLNYVETENRIKEFEKERTTHDMLREQALLDRTNQCFVTTKQEYLKFLSYATQQQIQAGRDRMAPR